MMGRAAAILLGLVVVAPVLSLGLEAAQGSPELWAHLAAYVLPQALRDTILLLTGVGIVVTVVGTGAAWLVTAYDFPFRRPLEVALMLPLAVPTYVVAYAFLDLLHPIGPIQTGLRHLLGAEGQRAFLPELRSLPGCVLLLGFVLYPYVYLPARALFLTQAGTLLEAAAMLGAAPGRIFLRVAAPLARPAIALGASLALMETLNDVGATEFLGVRTLTVQVYATWVNRSDLPGAAQLALVSLCLVLILVAVERVARAGRSYRTSGHGVRPFTRRRLRGWGAAGGIALALTPTIVGFALPAGHLAFAAFGTVRLFGLPASLPSEIGNTLLYAGVATFLCAAIILAVAAAPRLLGARWGRMLAQITMTGYALPGTVLVIGLLTPLALADSVLAQVQAATIGAAPLAIGLGSGGALVLAYAIRFLTIGVGAAEAGLARVPASLVDAARALGRTRLNALLRIEIPLAWPAITSGLLLIFVDCAKELPATLLLRPLNVETLSTHIYGEAARGTYENGAVAALLIVALGLLPVALLLRGGPTAESAASGLSGSGSRS